MRGVIDGAPGGPRYRNARRRGVPLRSDVSGSAYWLARCEGFLVDSPNGRIGVVEEVVSHDGVETPAALRVRCGRLGTRLLTFAVDQVVDVQEACERIVLRGSPRPLAVSDGEGSSGV